MKVLKIFVAGASDVEEEQKIAVDVINSVSRVVDDPMQLILRPFSWRHETPLSFMGGIDPQKIFNEKIVESDILIIIIGEKYGKGYTEEEANLAIKLNKESLAKIGRPKPQIIVFFRKLEPTENPDIERKKVDDLKIRLDEVRVLPYEYETPHDFELSLTHALYRNVIRFKYSTFKHKCLSAFWNLGISEGHELRIDVIYPAVDDPSPNADYWRRRLLPNIVFEDSKAIQKLEKTFRLIGLRSFRFYNCTDVPNDLMYYNRVWLCLPRSKPAQQALQIYENRCVFEMIGETIDHPGHIIWRAHDAVTTRVFSPLRRYLELQRVAKKKGALSWNRGLRDVIARDYGVLARFKVDSNIPTTEGNIWEYFIAGIRGLGTWGAGWFIDRRYQTFRNYSPYDDIQLLLEVTYEDGRIREVRDVSNETQDYFTKQNSDEHINTLIEEYENRSHRRRS